MSELVTDPVRSALVLFALVMGTLLGYNAHPAQRCAEDEVYAVVIDTNPAHGVARECRALDNIIAAWSAGPLAPAVEVKP